MRLRFFKIGQTFRITLRLNQERAQEIKGACILRIGLDRLLQLLLRIFIFLQADVYLAQLAMSAGKRRVRLQHCLVGLLRFVELRRIVICVTQQEICLGRSCAVGEQLGEYILGLLRLSSACIGHAQQVECRGVRILSASVKGFNKPRP